MTERSVSWLTLSRDKGASALGPTATERFGENQHDRRTAAYPAIPWVKIGCSRRDSQGWAVSWECVGASPRSGAARGYSEGRQERRNPLNGGWGKRFARAEARRLWPLIGVRSRRRSRVRALGRCRQTCLARFLMEPLRRPHAVGTSPARLPGRVDERPLASGHP
jgi:hypothetical protein